MAIDGCRWTAVRAAVPSLARTSMGICSVNTLAAAAGAGAGADDPGSLICIRAPLACEVKVTAAASLCLYLGKLAPAMVMMRGAICPH